MVSEKVCRSEMPIKLSSEGRNCALPFPKQECHIQHSALCSTVLRASSAFVLFFVCFFFFLCVCVATHTVLVSSEGQCHLELSRKALVPNTRARIIQLVLSQFMWQKYSAKSNLF